MPHLQYLDALRGIAVLGVLFVHSALATKQTDALFAFSFSGQRGVQLFYIVSAFTLYRSLDLRESTEAKAFLIRRFFRIAPMFYLAIFCNLLITHGKIVVAGRTLSILEIASAFVFLNGLSPHAIGTVTPGGWSVAVETTFYALLLPIYSRVKSLRAALFFFVAATVPCLGISTFFAFRSSDNLHQQFFSFLYFPVEFPVFIMGIITYYLWKQYIQTSSERISPENKKTLSAFFLLVTILIYGGSFPLADLQLYCSSLMFVPLLLALAIYPWKILVNVATVWVGKISYSIYLTHVFVIYFLDEFLQKKCLVFATAYIYKTPFGLFGFFFAILLISVAVSSVTYRLVEKPGMSLGRRLIKAISDGERSPA